MNTVRTRSADATAKLGAAIGRALEPGDVVGLVGPLGAGKTLLVRGIVAGIASRLEAPRPVAVCSPSFTMVNTYELDTQHLVHHMDLYRVTGVDDLESIGYWDAVADPEAIALVEWLDQVAEAHVERCVELVLTVEDPRHPDTSPRCFQLTPEGEAGLRARISRAFESVDDAGEPTARP